jgi:hypothetical protein
MQAKEKVRARARRATTHARALLSQAKYEKIVDQNTK